MKQLKQHPFFVPSSSAQKYVFFVGTKIPLTIIREEQWFYQVEQDNQKKPLGGLIPMLQYLHRYQAKYLDKNNKPKRMFYLRDAAKQMLREGYTVVHVESGNRLSYTGDYSRIVCSSSIVLDNDVPPGNFCIDFTEPKLPKTFKEMQAERQQMMDEKDRAEREAKKASTKEAVREFLQQQQLKNDKMKDEVHNEKSKGRTQSVSDAVEKTGAKKKWPYLVAAAVGGIIALVGESILKNIGNNDQSFRNAS